MTQFFFPALLNSKSLIYYLLSFQSGSKLPSEENAEFTKADSDSLGTPFNGRASLSDTPFKNTSPLTKSRFRGLSDFWKSLGKCELNVFSPISSHGQREVKSVTLFPLVPPVCALWEKTTISRTWTGMELLLLTKAARG